MSTRVTANAHHELAHMDNDKILSHVLVNVFTNFVLWGDAKTQTLVAASVYHCLALIGGDKTLPHVPVSAHRCPAILCNVKIQNEGINALPQHICIMLVKKSQVIHSSTALGLLKKKKER